MVFGNQSVNQVDYDNVEDHMIRDKLQRIREIHARRQAHDYSHVFREKSRLNLVRLSCVIIGIEFAYAAETAFVSPLLLELGISHKHMTMIWCLPPILGLLLAPLLGPLSDKCRLSWGRRRPFILILAIILFIGLMLVAWGADIGTLLGDPVRNHTSSSNNTSLTEIHGARRFKLQSTSEPIELHKYAAIVTVIGSVLLDFGSDNSQSPARTYLLDLCISPDHTKGLSIFTVMAGFGACVGYSMGGINWEQTAIGQFMGGNVKTVFTIVCIVLVISCTVTLTSYREIPLPLIERDPLLKPVSQADIDHEKNPQDNVLMRVSQNFFVVDSEWLNKSQRNVQHSKSSVQSLARGSQSEQVTFGKYLKSIWKMPNEMKILCFTNLLAWMGNSCYSLYFTDFVGESVFGGNPIADEQSEPFQQYQNGLRFGCWGMAIYALSCACHSMIVERLIQMFGIKTVTIGSLLSFSIGMLMLALFPMKWAVLLWSITAGILYSTIFTIPYLLMANYHASGIFQPSINETTPLKQTRGLGTDMAILSSMMFVAQILVSLAIGPLVSYLDSTKTVIYAASLISLCATISATQVIYFTND